MLYLPKEGRIKAGALFLPVIYTLLQILSIMLVGFVLAVSGRWGRSFFQQLSRFLVRVALPVHFFVKLSQITPDAIRGSLLFPGTAVVIIGLSIGCGALVFRLASQDAAATRVGIAQSTFGNAGMIPLTLIEIFPLTVPLIGERFGTTLPSLYVATYLLVSSPLMWTIGNFLIAKTGQRFRFRELITPPLVGIVSGLLTAMLGLQPLLLNNRLPFYHVLKSLERFGAVTFPLILLCLGAMIGNIRLHNQDRRTLITSAGLVSVVRFLLIPLGFLLLYVTLLRRLPLTPAQVWVLFLETHIPPASNLSMMAAQAGMNEDQVSFTTLATYLIYILVLPVYLLIFLTLMF